MRPKTSYWRRLETIAAWLAASLAWCGAALALAGPCLGGTAPGPRGLPGYLIEVGAAMWIHVGELSAIAAVVALLRRLHGPAAALGVVALTALLPEYWPHPSPRAARGPTLRIAAANLCFDRADIDAMIASLRDLDADVLVLPEFTGDWAARLEPAFTDDYPHRWVADLPERAGDDDYGLRIAVWSRLPGSDFQVRHLPHPQARVTLRHRGRAFALFAVHAWPPHPYRQFHGVWRERRALLDWIRGEPLPVVVAGDCNAAPRSPFVRRLRQCGLRLASEEALGRAPLTWPMEPGRWAPLRIAIDHVLHGEAFRATGFRRGLGNGSDHAPVVAELTWRE